MSYLSWRISFQDSEQAAKSAYMQVHDLYIEKESLQRTVAQQAAVIAEQKDTIASLQYYIPEEADYRISKQSELIEKLADVLKCVDGGHTEHGWLGEMGKIEMWRVDEAISDYNQWQEKK